MASSFAKGERNKNEKLERKPGRLQKTAGKPAPYWQRMLDKCQPEEKMLPLGAIRAGRMPQEEIDATCKTLMDERLAAKEIGLDWWLENAGSLHSQDEARIICAIGKRQDARQIPGLAQRAIDAARAIDDPVHACATVAWMFREACYASTACDILERDISKYLPHGAAAAIEAGLGNPGTCLRVARLMQKLPVEDQLRPVKKAIGSQDIEVARIGLALLEKQQASVISDAIQYEFSDRRRFPAGVRLARRIRKLPKKLQAAPILAAIVNDDKKVAEICVSLLKGKSKAECAQAIDAAIKVGCPAAIQLMAKLKMQPPKVRMGILKRAILGREPALEREGMRLLILEPKSRIARMAEDLLGLEHLLDTKMVSILGLLKHVHPKKRAEVIRKSIVRGGKIGNAAFALIGLAREGERAALFLLGCSRLVFQDGKNYPAPIDTAGVFASLSPSEKAAALLAGFGEKDEKVRRVFASLISQLDKEGLRRVMPKALRSKDSHIFKSAYDSLAEMGADERAGLCDYTAAEVQEALGREWTDGTWIASSFAPFMKDKPDEKERLENGIRNTIMRIKAVMLTPYMKESERAKVEEVACDSLEEFLRESKSDIEWIGNDMIALIPFQPKKRQELLYELAAEAVGRALEPHTTEGKKVSNGIGMSLAEAIPLLPEKHRPALFAKAEEVIKLELKDRWLHTLQGKRLIRVLSHLPRETQVKYASRLTMSWTSDNEGKELVEKLMPGVLEESRKRGFAYRWE